MESDNDIDETIRQINAIIEQIRNGTYRLNELIEQYRRIMLSSMRLSGHEIDRLRTEMNNLIIRLQGRIQDLERNFSRIPYIRIVSATAVSLVEHVLLNGTTAVGILASVGYGLYPLLQHSYQTVTNAENLARERENLRVLQDAFDRVETERRNQRQRRRQPTPEEQPTTRTRRRTESQQRPQDENETRPTRPTQREQSEADEIIMRLLQRRQ
jgi:hypothetical protein